MSAQFAGVEEGTFDEELKDDDITLELEPNEPVNDNPNVDDQLATAPSDDGDTSAKLTAKERLAKFLDEDEGAKEYSDGVQKRIDKLTYNWRESERREQTAIQYAQNVHQENEGLKAQRQQQDGVFINEYKGRVEAEVDTAKRQYREAFDTGDSELIAEANANLSKRSAELNSAEQTENRFKRNSQRQAPQQQYAPQQPQQQYAPQQQQYAPQQPAAEPDAKATAWAEKNKWFGEDKIMTNAAMSIHSDLVTEEGFATESDGYYAELNKRIRKNFPHKFQTPKQTGDQVVAPGGTQAGNPSRGKRTVKLSPSQVNIAKRLGVPLEEYAKYV